jgi:hypothetical protein
MISIINRRAITVVFNYYLLDNRFEFLPKLFRLHWKEHLHISHTHIFFLKHYYRKLPGLTVFFSVRRQLGFVESEL